MAVRKMVVGHRADLAAGFSGGFVSVHIRYLCHPLTKGEQERVMRGAHVLRNKLRQTKTSPFSLRTNHSPRFRYHPPHCSKHR